MNNRYCCYRHFKEGKLKKDSTYCQTHVPLGVINPIHQPGIICKPLLSLDTKFEGQKFRIKNRTHDYNEIEHKNSMPNRLIKSKVYIEKVTNKNAHSQNNICPKQLLIKSRCYESQYDTLCKFYKKIANNLKNPTKKQLKDKIIQFMVSNRLEINKKDLLLDYNQFKQFFSSVFIYTAEQIERFWELAYNDRRFLSSKFNAADLGQYISMVAFVHNFDKFYLQEQTKFVNMFSEAALKQRVIDIRHFLHPWYKNNIHFLVNMKTQRQRQQKICQFLKQYSGEEKQPENQPILIEILELIQKRNAEYQKLRIIAKFIYDLTDNKYLTFEKIKQSVTQRIQIDSYLIQTTYNIIEKFMEIKQLKNTEQFAITEIFQFMKLQNCTEAQFELMAKMLRRLVKFIFFHRQAEHSQIILCPQTLTFKCQKIIYLTPLLMAQFFEYQQSRSNAVVKTLHDGLMTYLEQQIMQSHVQRIKQENNLQNQCKIKALQCNFIAEGINRYFRRFNLVDFWALNTIISQQNYENVMENGRISAISLILQKMKSLDNQSVEVKKSVKDMFRVYEPEAVDPSYFDSRKTEADYNKYSQALEQYRKIGQKTKKLKEKYHHEEKKDQQAEKNDPFNIQGMFDLQNEADKIKIETNEHDSQENRHKNLSFSLYTCQKDCCSRVSSETQASISAVESLQSKLYEMLNF